MNKLDNRFLLLLSLLLLLSSCAAPNDSINPPTLSSSAPDSRKTVSKTVNNLICTDDSQTTFTTIYNFLRPKADLNICQNGKQITLDQNNYDFPIIVNKQVKYHLDLFQTRKKKYFSLWLSRSGRYLPMIHKELYKAGLPQDLAYVAMIESGYNSLIFSHAKAGGLWQFMAPTARDYNLRIHNYVDERLDPEKSTKAAVAYLGDLYKKFGDWHLAVAAYNAGQGRISKGLRKFNLDNYWNLSKEKYLSLETKEYVPKLIAAIIIAKNPKRFGFDSIDKQIAMSHDNIEIDTKLSLEAIAKISATSLQEIKKLNPELVRNTIPPSPALYTIKIPRGSRETALNNINKLYNYVVITYKPHIVNKGETLSSICNKYHINKKTILKINKLIISDFKPGIRLKIPVPRLKYDIYGADKSKKRRKNHLVLHKIKPGETLIKIARQYSVNPKMIAAWNGLTNTHKIRSGKFLSLYVQHSQNILDFENYDNTELLKITPKHIISKYKIKTKFNKYIIRDGDSLWSISKKFNITVKQLINLNNLQSDIIKPGSSLKVINI